MKAERFTELSARPGSVPCSRIVWLPSAPSCVRRCSNRERRSETMTAAILAFAVFMVVAVAAFMVGSIFDQRSAQARLIKERLASERKAPERAPEEELALLRDEQLSQIPALDNLLRRSERISALQKVLAQAGINIRAGNFLALSGLVGVVLAVGVLIASKRFEFAWVGLLAGLVLSYSYASYKR